jgi:transposase-like protein
MDRRCVAREIGELWSLWSRTNVSGLLVELISRFTDEQIVAILREADRDPIATVAKRHGVSEQTIYTWR